MLFRQDELRHLWKYYLFQILTASFAVVWIYMVVYFKAEGFTYAVISLAFGLWGFAMVVFEVPTGAVADTLGRKASTIIGILGHSFCMLAMPFVESAVVLCLLVLLWGTMVTMISGAFDAWMVDFLKAKGRQDLVKVYFVRTQVIISVGFVVASILSGLTVKYFGMRALWFINGTAALVGAVILYFQEEEFERKEFSIRGALRQSADNMIEGARFSLANRNVLLVIIGSGVFFMAGELGFINWRPYLLTTGIALENLAFLSTAGWLFCAGVTLLITRMQKLFRNEKHFLAAAFALHSCVAMSLFFIVSPVAAAVMYILAHTRMPFMTAVVEPYFQSMLKSRMRATVGSFKAMVIGLAFMLADGANALFADSLGVQFMMGLSGIFLIPAVFLFLMLGAPAKPDKAGGEDEISGAGERDPAEASQSGAIEEVVSLAADTGQA